MNDFCKEPLSGGDVRMPKVLLLCASHNDLGLIRSLRKLGYYIIATGMTPGLIGEKYVDKYVRMDYSNKENILRLAESEHVSAICQCCNDFGVYTAAYVAEQLGLPGYDPYETTLMLHNKHRFKQYAKAHQIPAVESFSFSDHAEALEYCRKTTFPIIIKPTDASAGNGISRLDSFVGADAVLRKAFSVSRSGQIVIEWFLTGKQYGFCTFLVGRKVVAFCNNNEYSFLNPYRVEIDMWPADNDPVFNGLMISLVEKIAEDLQLCDGIFHLQYIVENGKPYVIEVMRRVLGNMYGVPAGMVSGFDWDYWECRAKTGLSCKQAPRAMQQEGFFAYKTILAPQNGAIESIDIPADYEPYVWDKIILKQCGMEITKFSSEPVGFLFMIFPSREIMKKVLLDNYRNDLVHMVQIPG